MTVLAVAAMVIGLVYWSGELVQYVGLVNWSSMLVQCIGRLQQTL